MLRAWAIHLPQLRNRPGSSLGPMTTSATIAMTRSSGLSIPNMGQARPTAMPPGVSDLGRAVVANFARRRGRGLGRDRLGGVARLTGLLRRCLFLVADALLEGRQALAEVAHQLGNLAATAKQQQHDGQHDEPMPYAEATHCQMLPITFAIAVSRIMAPRQKGRQPVE